MSSTTPRIVRTALRSASSVKPRRLALRHASSSTSPASTSSGDLLLDILPPRIQPLISKSSAKRLLLPQSSKIPSTQSQSGNELPPPNAPKHVQINHPTRLFQPPSGQLRQELLGGFTEAQNKEAVLSTLTGMSTDEIRGLNRYTVIIKRVVNMTKKGKMPSLFAMVVVGSPSRGLVGIGRGRGDAAPVAMDSAFQRAVLSMDHVDKFEGRTLWGAGKDLRSKWGSTEVIMRGRPAGFGLAVPPTLHRLLTACGIRDCSATIKGSRNPMQTLKAAIQILHGGSGAPGFGNGTGKKGQRKNKGVGMRGKEAIERERGRFGVEVGRRL